MINEVIKHYIGSYCLRPDGKTILQIYGVLGIGSGQLVQHQEDDQITYSSAHACKLLLYPLSAMTEEQCMEWFGHRLQEADSVYIGLLALGLGDTKVWTTLLGEHFDLFGLIPSGEAIDVTTLEVNPYKVNP